LKDSLGLCPPINEDRIFKAVGQCALEFGVIMTQFTFSVGTGNPGTNVNGQFSGLGLNMFNLGTDITVTNDIQSKD
jgi:hypothetical protein